VIWEGWAEFHARSFIGSTLHQTQLGRANQGEWDGRGRQGRMGEIRNSYEVETLNVTGWLHLLEDFRVDRRLILKWNKNRVILDRDQWQSHVNIEINVFVSRKAVNFSSRPELEVFRKDCLFMKPVIHPQPPPPPPPHMYHKSNPFLSSWIDYSNHIWRKIQFFFVSFSPYLLYLFFTR
jgi:hypothetical protein